ncbi:MAG TPA: hypothetical protein PLJ94_04870 [Methylotenera sp.]|nr:hypothetical protein [Methylotenera sp.]HPH07992.1 hypothetical protein [Methylotenera sp.]HPM50033.1 hypothetical protein [Methylotenera sp.]
MNKLIALLLITLPLVSNAKVLAWIENKGGGKIVLTDTFCESETEISLLTYTSSTEVPEVIYGCYQIDLVANQVHIQWRNRENIFIYEGDTVIFPEE